MNAHRDLIPYARPNLSLRVAVEAFFRQRRLFFGIVFAILVITVLLTLLLPKQYSSEMKFLVQNARGNVVITPERTNPLNVVNGVSEEQVNSEVEILHSRDVIDPVADPGWETIPASLRTADAIRAHDKLLSAFAKKFGTEIVRKTNVINVSVLSGTPEGAKDSLDRLSAAYLAEHKRLQRPEGASDFFRSEADRFRKAWNEATQKITDFQQQNHLVSLSDAEADLDAQISSDEEELRSADASLHELDSRLTESAKQMHTVPARQTTQERAVPNQQVAQQLSAILVDLENKRTALLTNYDSTNRLVRELDKQIATTKAVLDNASAVPSRETTTDVDPAWQQVHTNHIQTLITRRGTAQHVATLTSQLAALKQSLAALQVLSVQYSNLESQADEMKANYELYAQKRDQAQMEDAMDEQKLLNVAVAQRPTLSYAPVQPKPFMNIVLGSTTAFFLGCCAIYFAEMGRNTIATPRELDVVSRYPLLATVPRFNVRRRSGAVGPPVEGAHFLPPKYLSPQRRPLLHALLNFWRISKA